MEERESRKGANMKLTELGWKHVNAYHLCYLTANGKILGEIKEAISFWAEVNGRTLGRFVTLEHAKREVEFALTGERNVA